MKHSLRQSLKTQLSLYRLVLVVLFLFTPMLGLGATPSAAALVASEAPGVFWYIQWFFSSVVGALAIPGLFFVAGICAAREDTVSSSSRRNLSFSCRLRGLSRSLLVPYLGWSVVVLLVVASISLAGARYTGLLPATVPSNLRSIANAVIGFDGPLLVEQLWYLRNLFVFSLLAPTIVRGMKRFHWGMLSVLVAVWLSNPVASIVSEASWFSLVVYVLGILVWQRYKDSKRFQSVTAYSALLFLGCSVVDVYLGWHNSTEVLSRGLHGLTLVFGIIGIAFVANKLRKSEIGKVLDARIAPHWLFIFAGSYPLSGVAKKAIEKILLPLPFPKEVWYFIAPFLIGTMVVTTAIVIARRFNPVYAIATGRFSRRRSSSRP